jgi:phosphoribosyl 1,2-cyclic phosphodiesterase
VLASGSSGNAAFLATEKARVLIDAGLSVRELAKRLASIGEDLDKLTAMLVTHEHSDHVAGLAALARRRKETLPIYLTHLTAPAIDWGECHPCLEKFQAGARLLIGDIEIDSFTIPHDAADPVGFCFRAGGVKIGYVTDLGYIPASVKFHLRGSHLVLLESNHDLDMLKVGPYPWSVKQRVMSRMGHLSNEVMSNFLLEDFDAYTEHLVLGHLSEHNNHPAIVRMVATQALQRRGLTTTLEIAAPRQPTGVFQF